MKRLRRPLRLDKPESEKTPSGRLGRWTYLALLFCLIGAIAYYLAGGLFVLSADGVVLSDRHMVAARYPGTIMEVLVQEGDKVEAGQVVAKLESFDTVKTIAELSLRGSELDSRHEELRAKVANISEILPLAKRTAAETSEAASRLSEEAVRDNVPMRVRAEALNNSFEAVQRATELSAQADVFRAELKLVSQSQAVAKDAIERLRAIYDGGLVRAPATGIVGSKVAPVGTVVERGDELLEIFGGSKFVLAYLPDSYLFAVKEGTRINVRAGNQSSIGIIESVMQIADSRPEDFQNTMRPRDRSRLARIRFAEAPPFALMQKVRISGCAFGVCWAD
ncbi:HlyD family secretion protein [Oricola thermophila]|uniref:HlyD family efflux transporter periplasmic adaptor subunit n=1 Tax=Oricola thermophila TaxID=2742145 RepID=A0A6N1VHV5_9HYPH|nr:HlyD family efflux transporter periplasmic adaptor subunit [Oricola thermophila]QKV19285.1 HlyD family efflux transporter periplasmic adaptor subunit [Oricola thermophila]